MRDLKEVEQEIRSIWNIDKYGVRVSGNSVNVTYANTVDATATYTGAEAEDPEEVFSYTNSNDVFTPASTIQINLMLGYKTVTDGFEITGKVDVGSPEKEERVAASGAICLIELFIALAHDFKVDKTRDIKSDFPFEELFIPLK